MSARWVRSLLVVLVLFSFGLSSAHAAKSKAKTKAKEAPPPAAVETESAGLPPAELSVGFQVRDSETEGLGDLLVPVWNPGGTGLLFLNPRTAIVDHDEQEGNLGIGYRQLLPRLDVILGANLYYDYRDTGSFNYDQWGFGLELLSPWIDARANYYDPDDKRNVVASETQTTVSQTVRTSSDWRDPYAVDHYVLQDLVTTRTLTTTTTTKTFEQYEQALGGYDWEIGLRLPIKSDDVEARVFGGYYDFDRDFGDDARGWKTRAELRVRSSLFLDAGLYENEDLTGSDWFAGARWSTPLDLGRLARGRNPFGAAKARLRGEPRAASARLTEMVLRDPQVRLEQSKFLENKALQQDDSSRSRSSSSQAYVVLPDVQFVDGDAGAAGDGTAERPFSTIQQGANAVYGSRNVYVYNFSGTYNENVVLLPDTTLWGSGVLIPGYDNRTFGSGIAPVVDGHSMGPSITLADRTTVKGFTIQNTDMGGPNQFAPITVGWPTYDLRRVGIYANNATDFTIEHNTIAGNDVGTLIVAVNNSLNFLYTDNLATGNNIGAEILATGNNNGPNNGTFNANFQNSILTRNNAGILLISENYNESIAQFQNGIVSDNLLNGIEIHQTGNDLAMALVSGVQANNNTLGIWTEQNGNNIGLVNISGTEANNNTDSGIRNSQYSLIAAIGIVGMPNGVAEGANNIAGLFGLALPEEVSRFLTPCGPVTANGNGADGLSLNVNADNFAAIGLIADVHAIGNGGDGINATVEGLNGFAALLALSSDALRPAAAVLGETILGAPVNLPGTPFGPVVASGNGGNGFTAVVNGHTGPFGLGALAVLLDTQTDGNTGDGINLAVSADDGLSLSGILSSDLLYDVLPGAFGANPIAGAGLGPVSASGNGGGGIVIEQTGVGPAYALLAGVDANNNVADDGILATVNSDSSLVGAFLVDVEASGNAAGRGIDLDLTGFDDVLAGVVFADANDNGQHGIRVTGASGNADAYALFAGIDADRNGALGNLAGLVADLTAAGDASAALTDVYAWNNTGRGANVTLNAGADANLFVGDFAAEDLDDIYGFSGDLGPLFDLIPTGNSAFSANGSGGFHAELTSANGDALVGISGANADLNANAGFNLTLNALDGNALAGIEWAYANDNDGNGFNLALNGSGGVADVLLNRVGANDNGANGINVVENYNGALGIVGESITATGNDANGVRLVLSGLGGVPVIDFGGGGDSDGQSSIFGNGNRDFRYNNGGGATVRAENNWWGTVAPVAGQFAGGIDYTPWLLTDPNAP